MHHKQGVKAQRAGFTLIELLVVIAIIAILAAILFPVFARARENARRASCQSNLKQIGLGWMQYAQDYDGYFPACYSYNPGIIQWYSTASAPGLLDPYVKSSQIFICPSSDQVPGYGYNRRAFALYPGYTLQADGSYTNDGRIASESSIEFPSKLVAMADSAEKRMYNSQTLGIAARHLETGNVLFADGHVKAVKPYAYNANRWYWYLGQEPT
jgi:prepilin-type N-terminal cleavage/methylation domain-containing protein/prepilin-type processing-associated H-X9-DG protein